MNRVVSRASITGLKGVVLCKNVRSRNKYIAKGKLLGKEHYLGTYPTPRAAHNAYCAWAKKAHGEFFRAS